MTEHILMIEDDVSLARSIEVELHCEGYQVSVIHDGLKGLTAVRELHPQLILLDWALPSLCGLEICRRLRSTGVETPIILLTAKQETTERVAGLDAGADDFVPKPFSIEELLARIRAHLRRSQKLADVNSLQFKDLSLDCRTRQVVRGNRPIELTRKEFELLQYFLIHPHQVLTRELILDHVWGYDFMGDCNIIEAYVRYLRIKLEERGEKRIIQTVRGVGYVLRD